MAKVVDYTAHTEGAAHKVYDERPHGEASIKMIILHHTGSQNEQGDLDWLSNWHPNPVSTHQLIQRSGTIVQVVANVHRAWHAGESSWLDLEDCNTWSIGVEICNNGMGEAYTEAQLQTVAETVAYNCARYHIPDRYVATHKQVRNEYIKRHGPAAQVRPLELPHRGYVGAGGCYPGQLAGGVGAPVVALMSRVALRLVPQAYRGGAGAHRRHTGWPLPQPLP
jgi:N-acetylmuramoyl-L-alanine amidase